MRTKDDKATLVQMSEEQYEDDIQDDKKYDVEQSDEDHEEDIDEDHEEDDREDKAEEDGEEDEDDEEESDTYEEDVMMRKTLTRMMMKLRKARILTSGSSLYQQPELINLISEGSTFLQA